MQVLAQVQGLLVATQGERVLLSAGDTAVCRLGAKRDQQPVVGEQLAVGEGDAALKRADGGGAALHKADGRVAQ